MENKKRINIHLVSDSTGETLGAMSRAVISQFKGVESNEFMWSLVRTKRKMLEVIEKIKIEGGIVLYTILSQDLLEILLSECKKNQIATIPALDEIIEKFSKYIGQNIINKPGRQHILDQDYFKRIEAINYTISHDDGQKIDGLEEAEIVIIGPSRTSKSPTCIYLSHRGLKAANIPFISGIELPEKLFRLKNTLIIGLTINSEALIQIRKNRVKILGQDIKSGNEYIDYESVDREVKEARKHYFKNNWPIIDVSKKSIEETAAAIIEKYYEFKKERNKAS
ncbi:MAG: kinase/pyrophosphorylase [Alphaproteobacteria bacterium]|jgi:[pyruvate, water dikinase]-phosphate phosphotransferase / [pyruvate, water dikinase] kinase|nr:kinase/pyrophosphorylase [Alphaproteobacteria bacterium]